MGEDAIQGQKNFCWRLHMEAELRIDFSRVAYQTIFAGLGFRTLSV